MDYNYKLGSDNISTVINFKMGNIMVTCGYQIYFAAPIVRLLIRLTGDLKVNCSYVLDLDKMFHTKQLMDSEYNDGNYFSKFLCHTYN